MFPLRAPARQAMVGSRVYISRDCSFVRDVYMITLTICCAVLPHSYPIGWILRIVGLVGKVSWVVSQAWIEVGQ